jgi:ribosome biogenesis GTPase
VVRRGARARREETTVLLSDLGWDSFFDSQMTDHERAQYAPARVVWEGRGGYRVSSGTAEWLAEPSGRLRHEAVSRAALPTTGDWVVVAPRPNERRATIQRVLARRTQFSRRSAGRRSDEQVIAANVDTVLLVTSLNNDFNLRRIERYLALAWESGANPVVVLNKADLCEESSTWRLRTESLAGALRVIVTSAVRGDGLADLAAAVKAGGTTALLGSSGVGKSTLVNALLGDARQSTESIREDDDRGRHRTTSRQLFVVPGGGVLIDTPGMRELQLWDAESGLEHAFADIEQLAEQCRFRDCSHHSEPGCAVTSAAAEGSLGANRLESYHKLQREERYLRSQQDERLWAERVQYARRGAKALRQHHKLRNR